jgi:hypothetical protein
MIRQFEIRWSDLGCPTAPDLYDYKGKPVLVTRSNIQDAQNNPDAICTVICATPVSGPETCAVGEIKLPDWHRLIAGAGTIPLRRAISRARPGSE